MQIGDFRQGLASIGVTPTAAPPPPPPPPPPEPEPDPRAPVPTRGWVAEVLPEVNGSVAEALERGLPMLAEASADVPALKQIFANRKLEKDALEAVPADLRARYAELGEALDEAPRTHLALQLDLLQGKLGSNPLLNGLAPGGRDGAADTADEPKPGEMAAPPPQPAAVPTTAPLNAAEARKRANALRETTNEGEAAGAKTATGEVTSNRSNVNTRLSDGEKADFRAQLEANGALEQQALSTLTPEQRAQYDRVAAKLADNPDARLSLQLLALEGKLPGPASATNPANFDKHFWQAEQAGDNLLTTLDKLADPGKAPMAEGIDRQQLLSAVVNEVADPTRIAQRSAKTCAATSASIMLADRNPAEYVRLATGLASPSGEVKLRNGDMLTREADTIAPDGRGRSISAQLLQPAFMEYANGSENYDNAKDTSSTGKARDKPSAGLAADESVRLTEGLFGDANTRSIEVGEDTHSFRNRFTDNETLSAKDAAADIEKALKAGDGVTVGIRWGQRDEKGATHGDHRVVVTGMDAGTVTFTNPWGRTETMSRAEFESRLKSAAIVKRS